MCLECLDVTDTVLAVATVNWTFPGPGRGVPSRGKAEVTWMRLCTGDIVSLSAVSLRHTEGMPGSMRERESVCLSMYV